MSSRKAGDKLADLRSAERRDLEPVSLIALFVGGLLLPVAVLAGHRAVAAASSTATAGWGALAVLGPLLLLFGGIRLVRHLRSRHDDLWS